MSLDNSTIQHPLPGDLQARVENALNVVTQYEAEEARLKKLCVSYTQNINNSHDELKVTQDRIKELKLEIPALEDEVKISKDILNELENRKVLVNNEVTEATNELRSLEIELEAKKLDISNRENAIAKEEKDLEKREKTLAQSEEAHKVKVGKLQEALS